MRHKTDLDDVVKATDFPGLDLIPADFSFRNLDIAVADTKKPMRQLMKLLRPITDEYDLLIIDSAPSISIVSENIFYAADTLLVPLIPTPLSIRTYQQLLDYFDKAPSRHLRLMPFFSMYDKRRELHRRLMDTLPSDFREILNTGIPASKHVEMMGVHRAPIGHFGPQTKPAIAFEKLWREVSEQI